MSITVIVPSVYLPLASAMIASIERNTVLPSQVILLDNSSLCGVSFPQVLSYKVNLLTIRNDPPLSVNASWNLGISKVAIDCNFICILNDDIILGPTFFARMLHSMKGLKRCGVYCPHTVTDIDAMHYAHPGLPYIQMRKREGWAMCARAFLLRECPPIPDDKLKTFYGDDWIWIHTVSKGWMWWKDMHNVIYHAVGATTREFDLTESKKEERAAYYRLTR